MMKKEYIKPTSIVKDVEYAACLAVSNLLNDDNSSEIVGEEDPDDEFPWG